MMRRFHKLLSEKEDIKAELETLFDETKAAFDKLPEFQEFTKSLREELDDLVGGMTHKLEVDFQAYNPANFFQALQMQASENGEVRAIEEMGTGEQQVLAMAFAHAYPSCASTVISGKTHGLADGAADEPLPRYCHDSGRFSGCLGVACG
jgi:putative ATP-dependent endonuclease of OLD family